MIAIWTKTLNEFDSVWLIGWEIRVKSIIKHKNDFFKSNDWAYLHRLEWSWFVLPCLRLQSTCVHLYGYVLEFVCVCEFSFRLNVCVHENRVKRIQVQIKECREQSTRRFGSSGRLMMTLMSEGEEGSSDNRKEILTLFHVYSSSNTVLCKFNEVLAWFEKWIRKLKVVRWFVQEKIQWASRIEALRQSVVCYGREVIWSWTVARGRHSCSILRWRKIVEGWVLQHSKTNS